MTTAQKIKSGLKEHHGSIKMLAGRGRCSEEWVRMVLNERAEDPELLLEAAELLRELNQRRHEIYRRAEEVFLESQVFALA